MSLSMPDCDVIARLPEDATNAVCARCARHLAGGTGPRQWIYCDRRERRPARPDPNSYVPLGARLTSPQAQATAALIEGLGRYSIGEELGRGGMGMVLAAHDTVLDREVALKVQIAGKGASPIARKRFAQELQTLATLQIDGIARVLDGGVTQDGMAWYVMERVEGPTLADVMLDAYALPRSECLRIVRDLARTLAQMHRQGIAHRDVKPSNILLTLDGRPVLVDFGLVTTLQPEGDSARLTVDIVGTPQYMAPEQNSTAWEEIDWVRVDVYALGMVLIECLTGALPPTANPTLELLPASVRHICDLATHPDPRHRYATPGALADALDAAIRGSWRPTPATYRLLAGVAGALTLALAIPTVTLYASWRESAHRETVAAQRLEATWDRIAALNPDDPDIEATFQAFVADEANQGTHAYHEAWKRRAMSSTDPDRQVESWATAWLTADSTDARNTSLSGLVTTFLEFDRWEALDALLVDANDDELTDAGLQPHDLRLRVALHARRFDEALAMMSDDDPRRRIVEHYRLGRRIEGLHDIIRTRPQRGWICTASSCANVDGRTVPGPIDMLVDAGAMGALFHRAGEGLFRADGTSVCEVDLPHLIEATMWNGRLALAAAGRVPGVLLLDLETCDVQPLPIANGGLDTWVTGLTSIDLDGIPGAELVVGLGPSLGYGLRAISSDGQRVLDDITLGNVRHHVVSHTDDGVEFVVSMSAFHRSRYFFPDGAPTGVAIVPWTPDGFGAPRFLDEADAGSMNAWTVDSADVDGDGDDDIVAVQGKHVEHLTAWVNEGGNLSPIHLGDLTAAFLRQLDDDAAYELITTTAGEAWILGMGDEPVPARAAPPPMPEDARPVFSRAMRLRRLGLLDRAAEEAERAARTLAFAEARDAWTFAALAWLDAGEPTRAGRAFEEAAHLGNDTAVEQAMDAYLAGWALAEAREFAVRTGLPSRAPVDYERIDLTEIPPAWVWVDPSVATWSASRGGVSVDAVNGVGPVLRFEVERRSDLYGVRLDLDAERLEWGSSAALALYAEDRDDLLEVKLDAHGGDGELYRRVSALHRAVSVPDTDPNGVHPVRLQLSYDRQRQARHAEGWMDGERMLNHEQAFTLAGDRLTVCIRLPPSAQVDGASIRLLLHSIELFGLVPTGRVLDPPERTLAEERAASMLAVRRNPGSQHGLDTAEAARAIDTVFRSQMYMHPGDTELINLATTELGLLAEPEAIEATPVASVLYADALVASGRTQAADAVYRLVIDSPDDFAAALAWAGLADTASIRGEDPAAFVRQALARAPNDTVGRAWLRRRRLGALVDGPSEL